MSDELIPAVRVRDALATLWRRYPSWLRITDMPQGMDDLHVRGFVDALAEVEGILDLDCEPHTSIGIDRLREVYRGAALRPASSSWEAHMAGIHACMDADPVWAGRQVPDAG